MDWIPPMEPISTKILMLGEEWIHQIKWDGIRGMTYIDESSHRVFTKNGNERTIYYPELNEIKGLVNGKKMVLDGEIVVLDDNNRPTFQQSLIRERVSNPHRVNYYARQYPVVYVIFDILFLGDRALTSLPLKNRREILYESIQIGPSITITDDFKDGKGLFNLMKNKNWEGIVSKRLDSHYLPAKNHKAWYKLKTMKKMLAVVCGIQWKNGFPNSLVLGIYQEEHWVFIGKASLGLTQNDLKNLKEYSTALKSQESPFTNTIGMSKEPITWLQPIITCWVSFLEWTNDDVLRHPKILGFSNQKAIEADGKEWAIDG